jgi:hypothetical protein
MATARRLITEGAVLRGIREEGIHRVEESQEEACQDASECVGGIRVRIQELTFDLFRYPLTPGGIPGGGMPGLNPGGGMPGRKPGGMPGGGMPGGGMPGGMPGGIPAK